MTDFLQQNTIYFDEFISGYQNGLVIKILQDIIFCESHAGLEWRG